ncbi:MAG: hypothetical protein AAFR45_02320 [Pseudomonadota bacterium]
MRINPTHALTAMLFAASATSGSTQDQPLSAIEWLAPAPEDGLAGQPGEAPVADTVEDPEIAVSELGAPALPVGLVPPSATGFSPDLFTRSDPTVTARLIRQVPVRRNPAMQRLLYALLLTETLGTTGGDPSDPLLLARIDRLMDLGAVDAAQSLAELADPERSPELFERWFEATLLNGQDARSCSTLLSLPGLTTDYGARVFCSTRLGDWPAAAIILDNAAILGDIDPQKAQLLDVFLHPELNEGSPPLTVPRAPDALTFRLFEAIGEPLPTAPLPRKFATADLRDIVGWKAQLEAAERLARSGALSANNLLGLYTERKPAASGGIWDRVEAVQQLDAALSIGSVDAVQKTLPRAWAHMRDAELEVVFAEIFYRRLAQVALTAPDAQHLVFRIGLLSSDYALAAQNPPDVGPRARYLIGLTQGAPDPNLASSDTAAAIAAGFDPTTPLPETIQALFQEGRLGEAILLSMRAFDRGARGNTAQLTDSLATLNASNLGDTARRAALQLLLLER